MIYGSSVHLLVERSQNEWLLAELLVNCCRRLACAGAICSSSFPLPRGQGSGACAWRFGCSDWWPGLEARFCPTATRWISSASSAGHGAGMMRNGSAPLAIASGKSGRPQIRVTSPVRWRRPDERASSQRNTPAAEMAPYIRPFTGSSTRVRSSRPRRVATGDPLPCFEVRGVRATIFRRPEQQCRVFDTGMHTVSGSCSDVRGARRLNPRDAG